MTQNRKIDPPARLRVTVTVTSPVLLLIPLGRTGKTLMRGNGKQVRQNPGSGMLMMPASERTFGTAVVTGTAVSSPGTVTDSCLVPPHPTVSHSQKGKKGGLQQNATGTNIPIESLGRALLNVTLIWVQLGSGNPREPLRTQLYRTEPGALLWLAAT